MGRSNRTARYGTSEQRRMHYDKQMLAEMGCSKCAAENGTAEGDHIQGDR